VFLPHVTVWRSPLARQATPRVQGAARQLGASLSGHRLLAKLGIGQLQLRGAIPQSNGRPYAEILSGRRVCMILGHETHYEGWTIYTSMREDKPDGWRPGDAIAYAGIATATPEGAAIQSGLWSSLLEQKIPSTGERAFDDNQLGHKTLLGEMRGRIESLRK